MSKYGYDTLQEVSFFAIRQRYRIYRANQSSFFASIIMCLGLFFLGMICNTNSEAWRKLKAKHQYYYANINPISPKPLDFLRYFTQSVCLLVFKFPSKQHSNTALLRSFFVFCNRYRTRFHHWLGKLPNKFELGVGSDEKKIVRFSQLSLTKKSVYLLTTTLIILVALLCITQPFDLLSQFIFVISLWFFAMVIRRIPGRLSSLMMIVLSLIISCRYIWWRYTSTLNWDDPISLICGLLLLGAETYAWFVLILGFVQTIWPLNRKPVQLPVESASWPTVDIMVPTYNEPLSVVKPTIYACLGIDWPKDKINIYILDDGGRDEFQQFAQEAGVHYIARPTHEYAKAGNINNALKVAKGEFVTIFDCDHIPTRSFLQLTMGAFLKEHRLAVVQTPHHFFSPDPFERNIGNFRKTPNEGALFYGLLQDGNDTWDATFFCGSCAVIRRTALDEVGGIAVETVTEDAHTSLKLHRRGWSSAYIRIPLAAGLATESLSSHIGQRIRWARGMVQIFRLDNPLFGKGLKLIQRLCYVNAMMHFLAGIPRIIFLTAPLAFLLFHAYIIFAPALAIALYVIPHMVLASLANSKIQGKYRHTLWSEIYETVLAWYIARPTTVALFNPHKGKFNVTAKGGLIDKEYIDWTINKPYLFLAFLNIVGLIFGIWRLTVGSVDEIPTVIMSMLWVVYNMIILGGAVAVSLEAKQVRTSHRINISMPAIIINSTGHLYPCVLSDYSEGGVGIKLSVSGVVNVEDKISLILKRGQREFLFPAEVVRLNNNEAGLQLKLENQQQYIDFIQCTFARADTWALWQENLKEDKPIQSMWDVFKLGFKGYQILSEKSPTFINIPFKGFVGMVSWLNSFVPNYSKQRTNLDN
ncbi:UDP-forming cellulose synthase catalytic subunit [Providencia burhodogranariea]|uniref:Cellulose synthase catalytic subunit [UDP-forming] n=1 Tax=Providencia burhodogranariea DSM 19968 TaxID=1141662 RepID=K8W9J6_9GAMM|nr:cellulose synthase catalytic subunit [Providencia burhodogranariea DSM 19968]